MKKKNLNKNSQTQSQGKEIDSTERKKSSSGLAYTVV